MIDLSLDGIACIVTGGTRGIGRDVVGLLLSQGARVVTSGVRAESIKALRSELADHADRLESCGKTWPMTTRGTGSSIGASRASAWWTCRGQECGIVRRRRPGGRRLR